MKYKPYCLYRLSIYLAVQVSKKLKQKQKYEIMTKRQEDSKLARAIIQRCYTKLARILHTAGISGIDSSLRT